MTYERNIQTNFVIRRNNEIHCVYYVQFLLLDEAVASRAVFVIVSGSDGLTDGNAFAAS